MSALQGAEARATAAKEAVAATGVGAVANDLGAAGIDSLRKAGPVSEEVRRAPCPCCRLDFVHLSAGPRLGRDKAERTGVSRFGGTR